MKYKYIVVDMMNLYWRSFVTSAKNQLEADYEGAKIFTGGIVQGLKRIKELCNRFGYGNSQVYFLFDNPNSAINVRKIIDNKYKHARDKRKIPQQLYKSLNIFEEILKNYSDNYHIIWSDSLEADDFVKPLLEHLEVNHNNRVLLVSADKDWSRSISDFCHWYDWRDVYTITEFYKKYEFHPTPTSVVMYKVIRGDASDNISVGVPRLPKTILLDIVNHYESANHLLAKLWETDYPEKWQKRIFECATQIKINQQLVDFIPIEKPIAECIFHCTKNIPQIRVWYEVLGLSKEVWMIKKEDMKKEFFRRKGYKYV